MLIVGQERLSQIAVCLKAASLLHLSDTEAAIIARQQITTIRDRWRSICDAAQMSEVDRNFLWRRQFLNPFAFQGSPSDISGLAPS